MVKPDLYAIGTILVGLIGYTTAILFFAMAIWAFLDSLRCWRGVGRPGINEQEEARNAIVNLLVAFVCALITRYLV